LPQGDHVFLGDGSSDSCHAYLSHAKALFCPDISGVRLLASKPPMHIQLSNPNSGSIAKEGMGETYTGMQAVVRAYRNEPALPASAATQLSLPSVPVVSPGPIRSPIGPLDRTRGPPYTTGGGATAMGGLARPQIGFSSTPSVV